MPGCPVISNCGTPNEKVSEFLDHHLQLVMKSGKSYVKDTGDFLENIKNLGRILEDAFLVTRDDVGLHPSIPRDVGLNELYEKLKKNQRKTLRLQIWLTWQNLYSKAVSMNLIQKSNCHWDQICTTICMYLHG